MRAKRHTTGSVRYDKRRKTWNYLWYDGTVRRSKRIGTKQEFPTKAAAWRAVERLDSPPPQAVTQGDTVRAVVALYEAERMPARPSTARVYRAFLSNHILPKWGAVSIRDLQPRPVEMWLRELPLAPKSKTHVRSLLFGLVKYAMWAGLLDLRMNPVSLVQNVGATRKVRKPRSLTAAEFHSLSSELREPHSTIALLCVCLGLRFSEALALQWQDVDWLGSQLHVRRGIVNQLVGDVKTAGSAKALNLAPEMVERLKAHRGRTDFCEPTDWVFASPLKHGRLPYSYTGVCVELSRAAKAAGIGHIGTHTYRHTYRSWLDAVGTSIAVQQKLMRHADIRTTMNVYGDVVTDEMQHAGIRVAQMAFSPIRAQTERKAS